MKIRPFADEDGYTAFSNYLLDIVMPSLPANAWKVLCFIVRKTRGWQKDMDRLSYGQIETGAGISSSATVSTALKLLLERELIVQVPGNAWTSMGYRINSALEIEVQDSALEIEATLKIEVDSTSKIKVPVLQKLKTQKKDSKEKKERDGGSAKRAPPPEPKDKKPTTPEPVVRTLADACKIDRSVATKVQRNQLYQSAGIIYRAGIRQGQTEQQIIEAIAYVSSYYWKHDDRGQKNWPLTPERVRDVWGAAIQYRDRHAAAIAATNGHEPKRTILSAEERRRIIAEEAARNGLEPDRRTL
jgi:phage replication O-like protein O